MKFDELDGVSIVKNFPEHGIKVGEIGTVVVVFAEPNEAYEVEFVDSEG